MGVAKRQGLGKLRHLECQSLWLQQRLRRGEFTLHKVEGETNPSDLFTKHLESQRKLDDLVRLFRCKLLDGRAATAPAMKLKPGVAGVIEKSNDVEDDTYVAVAHDPHVLPHLHLPEDIEQLFPRVEPGEPLRELDDGEHDLRDPVPAKRLRGVKAARAATTRSVNLVMVGTATPPRQDVRGRWRQRGSPSGTPESSTVPVCKSLAARPIDASSNKRTDVSETSLLCATVPIAAEVLSDGPIASLTIANGYQCDWTIFDAPFTRAMYSGDDYSSCRDSSLWQYWGRQSLLPNANGCKHGWTTVSCTAGAPPCAVKHSDSHSVRRRRLATRRWRREAPRGAAREDAATSGDSERVTTTHQGLHVTYTCGPNEGEQMNHAITMSGVSYVSGAVSEGACMCMRGHLQLLDYSNQSAKVRKGTLPPGHVKKTSVFKIQPW